MLQENTEGVIRVCGKVRTSEAELPLWRRCDCSVGQTDQGRLSQFEKPILRLELPADRQAKQRGAIAVFSISGLRFKKMPILETKSEAAGNSPARNVDLGCLWSGLRKCGLRPKQRRND